MRGTFLAVGVALAAWPATSRAAVITFDTAASPVGTRYGSGTHVNNSVAFTEDGILMRMGNFTSPTGSAFNFAKIDDGPDPFATNSLQINNILCRFAFSGLGFTVTQASVDYKYFGGLNTIGANGLTVQVGNLSALPATIGGVNVSVTGTSISFSSASGINGLLIGGQELWIDNVVAVPGPGGAVVVGCGLLVVGRRRRV